jgi:hypothetical protein
MHDKRTWVVVATALALGSAVTLMVERVRAGGIPTADVLTYTGELEAPDGTPVTGDKNIGLALYDAVEKGAEVCRVKAAPVALVSGRFQLSLPKACSDAVSDNPDLWSELEVGGVSLGRTKLGAVPYAIEAQHALAADNAPVVTEWALVPNPVLRYEESAAGVKLSGHVTTEMWRRVGDSIEVKIRTDFTAVQPDVAFVWDLPPGVVVASDKLAPSGHVGSAFLWTRTQGQQACVSLAGYGGVQVRCNGALNPIGGTQPFPLAVDTFVNLQIVLPVEKWGITE